MTYSVAAKARPAPSKFFNPIQWLLRLEAAYREADKLKTTEDHYLQDMGITRQQAATAIFGRPGRNS